MDFFPINNVKLTSVQKYSCEGQITEEVLLDANKAFKGWENSRAGWHTSGSIQNFYMIYSEYHYYHVLTNLI